METFKKVLSVFDVFGIRRIYGWLTNKKKIYEPKETFINWVIFILLIFFLVFIITFSVLSMNIDISFKNIGSVALPYPADIFGAGSFILALMLLTTIPFKIWFKSKRKQSRKIKNEKKK